MTKLRLKIAAAALVLLAAPAALSAQEVSWVETRFHRVHLQNGNFIDGHVLQVTENDVLLRMPAGDMLIRKYTIDRIELMKMRSLHEKPKLDPPLKKPTVVEVSDAAPRSRPHTAFPPAPASDELVANVKAVLSRVKIATSSQKEDLVEALVKMPQAAPYLASLLPTVEEEIAYLFRSALMRMKDPEATPYVVRALDSDKTYVQLIALSLLGIQADPETAAKIRPFLSSGPPAVRAAAIEALQQIGDVSSLPAIAELMGNPDDMVRLAAITASLEMGRIHDRKELVVSYVGRYLPGSDGRVAKELIGAVGRGKMTELWPAVTQFLKDADPLLRRTAATTLQVLGVHESADAVLIQLDQEQEPRIIVELCKSLVTLKSIRAVPSLIRLLRHSDENVVNAAASSLASLTNEKFGNNADRWTEWWERNRK